MTRTDLESELERLHPESYRWALACCRRDRETALDILQTSYLKVLEGRARFEGLSSFKTFFFGVIRRTAAEQRRLDWLARLRPAPAHVVAAAEAPQEDCVDAERVARLRLALRRLSGRQRQVLQLVFDHGLTVEEAGAALGISVGTARVHYDRGKKRLREALDG